MKKITNNILKKEIKTINNFLYLFIVFLALGALFIAIGIYDNRKEDETYFYLNDIIENKNNEENVRAYLNIAQAPYSIAKYENEDDYAFYIVFDGTYFYIAYLSNDLYNTLNVEGLDENPLTIYGTTATTPEMVRNIALEVYNEGLEEEDQIKMEDFNNYFGEVYLTNASLKSTNKTFYYISIIPFAISMIFITLWIIKKVKTKKTLNHFKEEELEKIEQEIEDDRTHYYKKYHLILTENYIISFNYGLIITKFTDLIWIYEQKTKQYGITTAKHIFIMTQSGKNYNILNTDGMSKTSNNTIKDIITQITNKNNKILVGYNKKNQEAIKEILKNS